ncbi:hypothetical protein CUZ56_01205 [Saezia sanguinis]|uniref:Uncharacterized protein n=1 Tax=Saezia sanguinis TaxID=1965230 RepID=A0A433SEV8_9BURK|nr:hypothetical protein [Saezia sanguinis]RUS67262.1 hypothetical protein CUZ56_01205 [Saezia sanguinis]
MGYTHYYPHKRDVPQKQWDLLCSELQKLWKALPTIPSPNGADDNRLLVVCDGLGEHPVLTAGDLLVGIEGNRQDGKNSQAICFNGDAAQGLDHETFMLPQQKGEGEEYLFCKTAHQPYDSLVIAVLILVHNLCPGCFDISSDGDARQWAPVCQWVNQVTAHEYLLPMGVISAVFRQRNHKNLKAG